MIKFNKQLIFLIVIQLTQIALYPQWGTFEINPQWNYGTIHIIGDSNAPYFFTNATQIHPGAALSYAKKRNQSYINSQPYEQSFFNDEITQKNNIVAPFAIHWVEGRTMHRIGKNGIQDFNLQSYHVKENDVAVFAFGAIDQYFHIHKQIAVGRMMDEIIETLVDGYIATILENKKLFSNLTVVILAVLPHKNSIDRSSLDLQIEITRRLNQKLEQVSKKNNLLFIDISSLCANQDGTLQESLSDGHHHLNPACNHLIKEQLISTLLAHASN